MCCIDTQVVGELGALEERLVEEQKNGRQMAHVYTLVQQATAVVPRVYLMTIVGALCIDGKQTMAKDIMVDLGEIFKAVQHPVRGLFARAFLLRKLKTRLPDRGNR